MPLAAQAGLPVLLEGNGVSAFDSRGFGRYALHLKRGGHCHELANATGADERCGRED